MMYANIGKIGGTAPSTGTGAGGAGIPRVTVSNDSQVKVWDGTNQMAVKAASTAPAATDPAGVITVSPNSGQSQGSTTSGQNGSLIMGAVTTSAPSYTTAQTSPVSLDTSGNIRALVTATNLSTNVAQINGVTPLMGNGVTGTGSPRVTIASDNSAVAGLGAVATGAAPPANAIYLGANASGATGGHVAGLISCDSHVFKHITTATDTVAVQGVASQTIYVCSWRSRAAGVATWYLENTASTNNNCSSANTQLTGVATEAANTGETWGGNFWSGLKNTSGNGLCINSTGTGGVDVDIWYTQL
jgi:hypothetical protein